MRECLITEQLDKNYSKAICEWSNHYHFKIAGLFMCVICDINVFTLFSLLRLSAALGVCIVPTFR
jgi:hypothetical protein